MSEHRFFLPAEGVAGGRVNFPPETAHQIRHVLRLGSGDLVIVLDGTAREYVVTLDVPDGGLTGTIQETRQNDTELPIRLVLYQALIKPPKMEMVLQKCTELGTSSIIPVETAHSVAGKPSLSRTRRYEAIIREAAEQSRRGRVPTLEPAIPFRVAVERAVNAGPTFLLWEGERSDSLSAAPLLPGPTTICFFVGPEGGFTPGEVEDAKSFGACLVTLGPRILRAETAAIAGTALLAARLMEL